MIPQLRLFLSFLAVAAALRGQTFGGSDDFGGGDAKWSYAFRRSDSLPENGQLNFSGGALEFTKGSGAGSYILGWDDNPTSDSSRTAFSYTTNWVCEVTATNTATTVTGQFAATGIEVAAGEGAYTAIVLGTSDGARWVKLETNALTDGTRIPVSSGANIRLRLAWNAAARTLTGSYSVDDGVSYATAGVVPITRWAVQPTSGFFFEAFGNANLPGAIAPGQVKLDDFSISAQNFTGSDDFSGGSAKWAYGFRLDYLTTGTNGALAFNGSALEFTKGAGKGSYVRGWDGDGIAGNDLARMPASVNTSWVMDVTATNTHVPESGTFSGVSIEAVPEPGQYAEIVLMNVGGVLYVRAEVNSPEDPGEDVQIPSGANVRLRVAWDAGSKVMTLSYSLDGTTYSTLRVVPPTAWANPPRDGFYFEALGYSTSANAVSAGLMRLDDFSIAAAPTITAQPTSQAPTLGTPISLSATVDAGASIQWRQNGDDLPGQNDGTLTLSSVQPANAGLYQAVVTGDGGSAVTDAAIVGVVTTEKVVGTGSPVGPPDIVHPNGNIFDQVLLEGEAAAITADALQVTRMSYIDRNEDIVQVEFSGAGTVSVVLDEATAAAVPLNYNQDVDYVRGHASIVVTGADQTTNLSVFTVGRGTAVNQGLFRDNVVYDGIADLAFIAISTTDGKFGGLRAANVRFSSDKGITGVYAPGVEFVGPMYVGDIDARDDATPAIVIGSGANTRVTGGDLLQTNGRPVQVSGLTELQFTAGSTSHYVVNSGSDAGLISAQSNQAVLEENGIDVTATVTAPTP